MRTLFALALAVMPFAPHAATLNLDPARSHVTLAGNVIGQKLSEQAPGSLTTTIGGTINITVANGQLQITSAAMDANTNGNWAPGRGAQQTSPADLAGRASTLFGDITGALRDLVVNAASSPRSLAANGQFDASAIIFEFPSNSSSVLEYDSFVSGKGTNHLAGAGTNQTATVGTLIQADGVQTLTITLNATFYFSLVYQNDTALTLTGMLVATDAPVATGPKITAVELQNGHFKLTAAQTSASTRVESSATFSSWSPQDATVQVIDASTRSFTLPASDKFRFFRLAN